MEGYKVSFVDSSGTVTSAFDFEAGAEVEVGRLTALLRKACDEQGKGFELRRGDEVIAGSKPPGPIAGGANHHLIKSLTIGSLAALVFLWPGNTHDPIADQKERVNLMHNLSQASQTNTAKHEQTPDEKTPTPNELKLKGFADYQRIILERTDLPIKISRGNDKPRRWGRARYEKRVSKRHSR